MTLFLELFLMLALYYMYSIQTQMIRLVENQMNHLHELNLILVCGEDEEDETEEDVEEEEDYECDPDCECCNGNDNEVGDKDEDTDKKDVEDDTCGTCNRSDEKCRCPNPYKLLSKKSQ